MHYTKKVLIITFLLCITIFIISPFLMIIVTSFARGWFGKQWMPQEWTFDWYKWAFQVANIGVILKNSIIIAVLAITMSLFIGMATAWAIARRPVPGKEILFSIILLPRMIPPITYALGISNIFYKLNLIDTYLGVSLAHVTLCLPFGILILASTFEGLDQRIIEAAQVCGASRWRTFFHVILPLVMPGILAAIIFTFTTSYNEFTLTIMTYGPHTVTLPVKTYLAIGDGYWEVASAISTILLIPSLIVLIIIQRLLKPEKIIGGFKGV
ncbi:ABC transporter permease [candidate division WOR-3 bacterium]|nr:ABC transporter permease [candidate division WOR-3 bacterium]